MVGPRLDEEDAGALVLRQACGQDASRRPAAHDDDVVGGGRRPHDRHQLCSLGPMIVMPSVSSTWRTKMYLSSRPSECLRLMPGSRLPSVLATTRSGSDGGRPATRCPSKSSTDAAVWACGTPA